MTFEVKTWARARIYTGMAECTHCGHSTKHSTLKALKKHIKNCKALK